MAVRTPNPLIALSAKPLGLASALEAGRQDKRARQSFDASVEDRNRAIEIQDEERAAAQAEAERKAQEEANLKNLESIFVGAVELQPLLRNEATLPIAKQKLSRRINSIIERTGDPAKAAESIELMALLDAGELDMANAAVESAIEAGRAQGFEYRTSAQNVPAGIAEFDYLTEGFSDEEKRQARLVKTGLATRAGTVTGTERIATEDGLGDAVAEQEGRVAAAREVAKLESQLELKPEVEAAVKSAVGAAALSAEVSKEDRSNARAMQIYDVAIKTLAEAMGNTYTGPVAGLMPAVTANQQTADGAVAAIAPVLKQMFRAAGEGIFTDKDQELLLAMVPTRKDLPDARAAKLKNIDAIVRAKLAPMDQGGADSGEVSQPTQQNVIRYDAQGNRIG